MSTSSSSKTFAFVIITFLFFLWGGLTAINDVLIDTYKKLHDLTELQSMYILLAFFGAYGFGALAYYLYSRKFGDPINKLGYKTGMLSGLAISGIGCFSLAFIMTSGSYYSCLVAFVIIGLGLTLLQISCNPYVAILGPSNTASTRLNLSQGFNSLGTTIGPLIAGGLISYYIGSEIALAELLPNPDYALAETRGSEIAIQYLYILCGVIFFAFGLFLYFIKLPDYASEEEEEMSGSIFRYKHLIYGMFAIFFYVGAEVMIGGKIIPYVQQDSIAGLTDDEASSYLGIYWGGAMIGRLAISVITSEKLNFLKKVLYGLTTILSVFLLIVFFISLKTKVIAEKLEITFSTIYDGMGEVLNEISPILGFIGLQFIAMIIFRKSSARLVSVFAALIIIALTVAYLFEGEVALWCMLSIGLFNSVMWSNIFTLSINGLGKFTSKGSSLLVIMIVGGAILPPIMGWLTDWTDSLRIGFLFPIISYLYILYFGLFKSKTTTN